MTLRIGIDVGGTNTDAVLLADDRTVLVAVKRPTTADIETGVRAALEALLDGQDAGSVRQAMLGTTQCTNAIVERRGLRRVGVLRIGAPATTAVPPLADWPDDLRNAVLADARVIPGGHHFDGREIAPLDAEAVRRAAQDWQGTVEAVAVSSVFSPADAGHEKQARELLREYLDIPISLSSEIGSIGLLERENATVMNAALTGVAERATRGFTQALSAVGVRATPFLSQNDGTLMTLAHASAYPVLTVASGPTNSLRGGALLSGRTDAIVIDIGGTTADFGALRGGFPRESGIAVEIGGVLTNFRMPDLVSVALGGGTIVRRTPGGVRIGPDSVGHDITRRAVCFGGDTLTLTDVYVLDGLPLGDRAAVRRAVTDAEAQEVRASVRNILDAALDRMRTSAERVTVVAVGGGSFLAPDDLSGAAEVLRPPHHEVANAIGAAIAEVSGEVDRVYRLDGQPRATVIDGARQEARRRAAESGAEASAVRDIELEEIQLAYLPGDAVRIRARAAGPLRAIEPRVTGRGEAPPSVAGPRFDVVAVGEVMGLLDPDDNGPLEDVSGFRLRVAGAEGNVLISLAHLGHATALLSAVGADPVGRLVTRTLAEHGVNIDHVRIDASGRTGVFFKERLGKGERRVYYYRDGSAAARLSPDALDPDRLGLPRILTVSGVTLGLGGPNGLAALARQALSWAAANGCTVVFDPNLRPSIWDGPAGIREFAELIPDIDVLLAGREEVTALLPSEDPDQAARRLVRSGMSAVVLKDGARGAVVYECDRVTRVEPFPVDVVVDPVGAGDAFAAGVISGLLHGWPVHMGARVGAVLGARAITVSGDWEAARGGEDAAHLLEEYAAAVGPLEDTA